MHLAFPVVALSNSLLCLHLDIGVGSRGGVMASIYFYYNELLRQSADHAVVNGARVDSIGLQQREAAVAQASNKKQRGHGNEPADAKAKASENQDDDAAPHAPFQQYADAEAALAALQPRLNRLAYLPVATTLARSLGPQP
jgi:hypothetical protein